MMARAPPSGSLPEDQLLLQMDQELDQRMARLLGAQAKYPRVPKIGTPRPTHSAGKTSHEGQIFTLTNGTIEGEDARMVGSDGRVIGGDEGDIELPGSSETPGNMAASRGETAPSRLSEAQDDESLKVESAGKGGESGAPVEEEDEKEVEVVEEDGIFDEFLDAATRARLSQLAGKVAALTQALQLAQEECRQMSSCKREASRAAQAAENERKILAKQIQGLRQESSRLQKANSELKVRVRELGKECQALRKEVCDVRQKETSAHTNHSTLQAQLTRVRRDCAALKEQLASTRVAHREEVEGLKEKHSEGEEKRRELERERRELSALTRKQERMIAVLTQQKNHLAAAKAVSGLEQKFLATITPLQPP